MSRIGKVPVTVPSGVTVEVLEGTVKVSGSKGNLSQKIPSGITLKTEGETLIVNKQSEAAEHRANQGLVRSLIQNMVTGVSQGFERKLEVNGVGFRVNLSGADLNLSVGYSHPVKYTIPQGISASVEQNIITIGGIDKQQVGQIASEIRALKKPEPYKGKGIKYVEERIIRKSGKSGKEKA